MENYIKVNVNEIAHGIMKDFMFAQEDKKIHDAIYDAIHQKGAFRKFRQVIEQVGIFRSGMTLEIKNMKSL